MHGTWSSSHVLDHEVPCILAGMSLALFYRAPAAPAHSAPATLARLSCLTLGAPAAVCFEPVRRSILMLRTCGPGARALQTSSKEREHFPGRTITPERYRFIF